MGLRGAIGLIPRFVVGTLILTGCTAPEPFVPYRATEGGSTAVDTGVVDTGVVDTGVVDAGAVDAGAVDTGVVDTGVVDTGAVDAGAVVADGRTATAPEAARWPRADDGGASARGGACIQNALTRACAVYCADPSSAACLRCVQGACSNKIYPRPDGDPAFADFGDDCEPAVPRCAAGLECVSILGGTENRGFCTRRCTNPGFECEGAPHDTLAACILGSSPSFCAFLCVAKGRTYPCPSSMICGDENPLGSGQRPCLP